MTLSEKKLLLESFLRKPFNIAAESSDIGDFPDSLMFQLKNNLIVHLLRKIEYKFNLLDIKDMDYFETEMDDMYYTLFQNMESWQFDVIEILEFDGLTDSEEVAEKICRKELEESFSLFFDVTDNEVSSMIDYLTEHSLYTNDSYNANILYNPYLNEMIDKKMVDVNCLKGLEHTMLIFPYEANGFYDAERQTLCWLTGWEEGCGMCYTDTFLHWRFIFTILYVEICYKINYKKNTNVYVDDKGFTYT